VTGFTDQAWIGLQSSASDGSAFAGGNLYYIDRTGTTRLLLEWGEGGLIARGYSDQNPYSVGHLSFILTSTYAVPSASFSLLPGFSCNMAANSQYRVSGILYGENTVAAAGNYYAFVAPAGAGGGLFANFMQCNAAGGIDNTQGPGGIGGSFLSPAYGLGLTYAATFNGVVTTASSSGLFQVQVARNAAANAFEVFTNSFFDVSRLGAS
jgi:hypothetical protein